MKKMTDLEIFLMSQEMAGLEPFVNHSDRQLGFSQGVRIGALIVRDSLSPKEATEKARIITEKFHKEWAQGKFKKIISAEGLKKELPKIKKELEAIGAKQKKKIIVHKMNT
ncbi:MAG: hypothetical protein NTW62_03335 [Candidatus Nomurabacteria bacterium]|nr:hypothetical protein [Candidatus Nomurabacteria bacterium]